MNKSASQWNAYVAAGEDRDERLSRLNEVPDEMRSGVEIHVKTVFALKRWRAKNPRR